MNSKPDIKRRRFELKLSRARVAELAGISERTLMRIENDESLVVRCRESTLVALAHALQWPVGRLTRASGETKGHFMSAATIDGEVQAGEARAMFGSALQARRDAAGFTLADVSMRTGIPESELVEVERGRRRMDSEDFERLSKCFPSDKDLYELWLSSRTIVYDFARLGANDRMDIVIGELGEMESRCREMFWNCPQALPGFAQTPEYTEQWLMRTTNMSAFGVRTAMEVNAKRVHSFIFRHPSTRLVLHYGFQFSIVDKEVMENQLKHLVMLSMLDGVEIRVLKPHASPNRALFGSWGVVDKSFLHAHNLNGAQTNASPHIVGFFVNHFEEVWSNENLFMSVNELLPL